MVWYFNFCSPYLNNDSVVNLNRSALILDLFILIFFYFFIKILNICSSNSNTSHTNNAIAEASAGQQSTNSQVKTIQEKEQKFADRENSNKQKIIKRSQKVINLEDTNKNSPQVIKKSVNFKLEQKTEEQPKSVEKKCLNIDIDEIQNMFPIVFGHHSIAIAATILYTPYYYQTIAAYAYCFFCILLVIFNQYKLNKLCIMIWSMMCLINISILMSALIGVGIANYDTTNSVCYGQELSQLS